MVPGSVEELKLVKMVGSEMDEWASSSGRAVGSDCYHTIIGGMWHEGGASGGNGNEDHRIPGTATATWDPASGAAKNENGGSDFLPVS